jgi:hypothetical protein
MTHQGDELRCPDNSGRTFHLYPPATRGSASFSEEEIAAINALLPILFRGGDPRVVVRQLRAPLGNVAGRFAKMATTVARIAAEKNSGERVRDSLDVEHTDA